MGNKTSFAGIPGKKRQPNTVKEPEKGTFSEKPAHGAGVNRDNQIVRSGLQERVCLMVFQGMSNREIGRKLGMNRSAVDRYVKSDHFLATYSNQKAILLGQVAEMVRDDLLEVTVEALRGKIATMRSKSSRVKPELRNKIQTELIELGLEAAKMSGGGLSSQMKAIFEKTTKTTNEDGSEITIKERIEGPTDGTVAVRPPVDVPARSRPTIGTYAGAGDVCGEDGPEKAPEGSGTPRTDGGTGS